MNLPTSTGLNKFIVHINKLPIMNRIFGYLILIIGAILGLASLAFCVVMIWSLITIIFDGSLFDNVPAEEWDIR